MRNWKLVYHTTKVCFQACHESTTKTSNHLIILWELYLWGYEKKESLQGTKKRRGKSTRASASQFEQLRFSYRTSKSRIVLGVEILHYIKRWIHVSRLSFVLWPYHPSFQQVWDCFQNVRTLPILLLSKPWISTSKPMKIWMFVYLLMLLQLDPLGEKAFSDFMEIQGARVREVASQFVHTFNFTFKGLFFVTCIQKISYS